MRVLVAHGSKMGGTRGLAEMLGKSLTERGAVVDVKPARDVDEITDYDVVIVGGALYAARWHKDSRRFVRRFLEELKTKPVWLFSSGPLDDSATTAEIPPVGHVSKVMDLLGARGHITFGGRLPEDAEGFIASSMAKTQAGDWRDPGQVDFWAAAIIAEMGTVGATG